MEYWIYFIFNEIYETLTFHMFVPNDKYMKTILKCADAFMPNSWRKNLVVHTPLRVGETATVRVFSLEECFL